MNVMHGLVFILANILPFTVKGQTKALRLMIFQRNLNSNCRYKLFVSYVMSLYGCDLHFLAFTILIICVLHGGNAHAEYGLPYNTRCFLLLLLRLCLPWLIRLTDRSLNFIKSCFWNDSLLVCAVAKYGVLDGCFNLPLGHKALFFAHIY